MATDFHKHFLTSELHFLAWYRRDEKLNKQAIKFMVACMDDPKFKNHLLPLLRPCGRKHMDYEDYGSLFRKDSFIGRSHREFPESEDRLPFSELWFQVSGEMELELWSRISVWIEEHKGNNDFCFAWRSHKDKIWQPFTESQKILQCNYLCNFMDRNTVDSTPDFAMLLKAIWYRASEEIARFVVSDDCSFELDPCNRKHACEIFKLLRDILNPFSLADYMSDDFIAKMVIRYDILDLDPINFDPKEHTISHMPAYAINALTRIKNGFNYELDNYGKLSDGTDFITHPYKFAKGSYLPLLKDIFT
ncbi:MAG: hypothetical protein ACYC0V_14405 [Armatimonadota bacterium]